MRLTLSQIQRRMDDITEGFQSPPIIFVKAVFDGEEVIDRAVYATVDEALTAFRRAHRRITSDMDNKSIIFFIDDVPDGIDYTGPDISEEEERPEAAIIGYTIQD